MNEKMIAKLEVKGFKRWTKETSRGTLDRLYLNAQACGLEVEYYKTGNVSSAHFNGERISNAEGRRMLAQKTYIDLKDDSIHSDYWNDTFKDIAQSLIDEATAEIEAEEKAEIEQAETEVVEETAEVEAENENQEDKMEDWEKGFAGMFGKEKYQEIKKLWDMNPVELKAEWQINYWKSNSGFSHSETVKWTTEHEVGTPEELKKSVLDWWYNGEWNDTDHDGHFWKVTFYLRDEHFDEQAFWVYPEDVI